MINKRILIIAGEASGDLLGATLAKELLNLHPNLQLLGMGGEKMRQAGVNIVIDNRSMDIMGWWEVLKKFSTIRSAMQAVKNIFKKNPPDLLILIDYPGFNLRIAKIAKQSSIKVLYYVSPQIWAWRYRRIHTIRKNVDHMAVLFAFEAKIYQKENVPVTFVGHPLTALIQVEQNKNLVYQQYQLDPKHPIIAIFPGSRMQEIHRLLPLMISTIQLIREKIPQAQFVLPLASTLNLSDLPADLIVGITIVKNNTYQLLSVCDAAIVKSGTGTLEVALAQVPLVVVYKTHFLNYWIARSVIQMTQIGLCNIVAQKQIAKEFIQGDACPSRIAEEIIRLITDLEYRQQALDNLSILRNVMTENNNSQKVAKIAMDLLSLSPLRKANLCTEVLTLNHPRQY